MLINGTDLMLFVGEKGKEKSIAFATSHQLDITRETKDVSHKDVSGTGGWTYAEAGLLSYTVSSENLVGDSRAGIGFDELFDLMISKQPIHAVFTLEGNSPDYADGKLNEVPTAGWTPKEAQGYEGNILITSLSQSAPNGEYATMSIQATGVGPLTKINKTTVLMSAAPKKA